MNRVAMCEVRSKEKTTKNPKNKIKYSGQQQKEIDCDKPHLKKMIKPHLVLDHSGQCWAIQVGGIG